VNHTQFFVFASYLLRELRGFAPIGILEYWNIGMMGSAVLELTLQGFIKG
jgi:hypothetical protein